MLVFTLCSNNYLPYALSLGNSIKATNSKVNFIIGLVDTELAGMNSTMEVLPATKVIDTSIFSSMASWYDVTELNTAVKPYYIEYFFNQEFDKIIYLDPDILVFGKLDEIYELLDEYDAVVTPHFITPQPIDSKKPTDRDILGTGVYNLGFFAVKKNEATFQFINWWKVKLYDQCFVGNGLFTDQLWVVYITCFLAKVKVLRNPGYNVANWNLHERTLSERNGAYCVNEIFPLIFFHFSNYKLPIPDRLAFYNTRVTFQERKDIVPLYSRFDNDLRANGYDRYVAIKPFYGIVKKKKFKASELGIVPRFIIRIVRKLVFLTERNFNVDIKAKF